MTAWDDDLALRIPAMRAGTRLRSNHRVLEIGPLNRPVVARMESEVTYVDHLTTEALRAKYGNDPAIKPRDIVEIDAVWGDKPLRDCAPGPFDYVFASHVMEHVPDLVTWLNEVSEVLAERGQLRVALPDCRFSFDVLRRETALSDVLTNYVLKARRPQVHNVLDFRLNYAPSMDGGGRYSGQFDVSSVKPVHSIDTALDSARAARDAAGDYFDVHCWVFQPRTFATLMADLCEHGLINLKCAKLIDTASPLFEFYAFMQRASEVDARRSWLEAAAQMRDPLPGSAEARNRRWFRRWLPSS